MLHGIDVSKWQGEIDWQRVASTEVYFAFARVSDGLRTRDGTFVRNFREMRNAGIVRGAYQFFRPNQDPVAQADLMLAMLDEAGGLEADDLPPVLDLEADDGTGVLAYRSAAAQWLSHVEQTLGRKPIIYTGARFENFTGEAFRDYVLWAPNYKTDYVGRCPNIADGWARWHFWQWTDEGRIDGIAGAVDRNLFDGSADDLAQLIEASLLPVAVVPVPDASAPSPDAGTEPDPVNTAVATEGHAGPGPAMEPEEGVMGAAGREGPVQTVDGCP